MRIPRPRARRDEAPGARPAASSAAASPATAPLAWGALPARPRVPAPRFAAIEHLDDDYAPFERGHLPCRDGRWFEYAVYGDPAGVPLIACHGAPGAREEAAIYGPAARVLGVRVFSLSRPGFGCSSRQPGRRVRDFADDVVDILELRGRERVLVAGYSAGAAYALAIAERLGDRVQGVGLLAPAAPFHLTGSLPGLGVTLQLSGASAMTLLRRVPAFRRGIASMSRHRPSHRGLPDASADAFVDSLAGAMRRGPWATIRDLLLVLRRWEVDPAAVDCRRIVIWQGCRDWQVPWRGTARLSKRLRGARLHLDATADHHTVVMRHVDELLMELVEEQPELARETARLTGRAPELACAEADRVDAPEYAGVPPAMKAE